MIHSTPTPTRDRRRLPGSALGCWFALAAGLAAAGCGNVTSGGFGDVEGVLASEEVADLGQEVAASILAEAQPTSHESGIQGTLTVRVRSFARRGIGDFVELTDGVQEIVLSLSDPQPVEIARRSMPAGSYDAVRTFFGRIEANIESGLVVDGQEITGVIPVQLGPDGTFSLVTYTGFDVVESSATVVAIEMKSGIWLRLVDAVVRRVSLTDFESAVRIRVRLRRLLAG
jgi:hypothetical protein